jgi:hypothetical protein
MTLNATLFFQIINFIIAYYIIDRVFLRKAVAIIQRERTEYATLMKDVQLQREKVAEREHTKIARWLQFREQFMQKVPSLQERLVMREISIPLKENVSPADVEWYAEQLKDTLIARVGNVSK